MLLRYNTNVEKLGMKYNLIILVAILSILVISTTIAKKHRDKIEKSIQHEKKEPKTIIKNPKKRSRNPWNFCPSTFVPWNFQGQK